jgi:hypothetical protein
MSTNGNGRSTTNLSDDLVAKARAIASRSDELLQLLEDARKRLLDADRETKTQEQKQAPKRRFKPKASPASKKSEQDTVSEGLRLVTAQMSVAGAGRDEIAERLRDEFAVEDPERILKALGL